MSSCFIMFMCSEFDQMWDRIFFLGIDLINASIDTQNKSTDLTYFLSKMSTSGAHPNICSCTGIFFQFVTLYMSLLFCCCCSDMLPSQQYRLIKYLLNTAGAGTAFWRCIDLIACAWCQNNICSRKSSALCRYAYVFACVLTFCVSRLLT